MAQDDGRAVAGDLNHVFGGVRTGRREISDDDLVNHVAVCVEQFSECGGPGIQFALQRDERTGYRGRLRAGETNYSYTAPARRGGNGGDGVVESQRVLTTGGGGEVG